MRTALYLAFLALLVIPRSQQHTGSPKLSYDVVSIHEGRRSPNDPLIVGGDFEDVHVAHLSLRNFTIQQLIVLAFGIDANQVGGIPESLSPLYYVVLAKSSDDTNTILQSMPDADALKAQRGMLEEVLAERFHLRYHTVTRDRSGYFLVTGKPLHLRSTIVPEGERTPDFEAALPTLGVICDSRGCQLSSRGQSMQWLALMLCAQLNAPVEDHTNLTERYDFTLSWSKPTMASAEGIGEFPPLEGALASELGLKLERGRAKQSILVVDHVEPPTPN